MPEEEETQVEREAHAFHEPDRRKLGLATGIAVLIALLVLFLAILPAEYGIDPTGLGRAAGFNKIHEAGTTAIDESNETVLYRAQATWSLVQVVVHEAGGTSSRSGFEEVEFEVDLSNVTALHAALDWTDDVPESPPDGFVLTLLGPGDRRSPQTTHVPETQGPASLNASVAVRAVPYPNASVPLDAAPADTSAHGLWRVRILMYGASQADDPGNPWSLTVRADTYRVNTTVLDAGDGGLDVVRLTLTPGASLEYKFRMAAGASLDYSWEATAAIHSDLHGDDPADESKYHQGRMATISGDEGSVTAPFDGRFGWFWHNRSDASVTITLRTQGDYIVLGVV